MKLTIASAESSLDALLDKIVEGQKNGETFELNLQDVSPRALMQVFELVQSEGGNTTLARGTEASLAI